MGFLDKAKELANQAKGKAEELAEKAGPSAAKGLDAAKSSLDKATGGKYHDKIENVSGKVEGMLKREHPDGQQPKATDDKGPQQPGTPEDKGPDEPGQAPKNP
ncbi:antitoxin [Saccharopolyspora indica]|uniref:antitoxin n=1 Tax=Saccharopolyspora indica TaxID=1229659 RepID=UPI0022EA26E7|nr:Rv0909 family putative TA system antitoxin [Saccharopolyspora indica]MDA3650020.1 Rv0909 family putative TA system antitoxin [Saccharopolyspora indica]